MKLPPQISMKQTSHGSGDDGMAFYQYEDAEGLGVVADVRRENARSSFVETWRFRWLADAVFPNLSALIEAIHHLPDEAVAAEKARWPVLVAKNERQCKTGDCWLHPGQPATHSGYVQTCWIESAGQIALLCAECATAAESDPGVVVRAGDQRRADVAAKKVARKAA